MFIFELSQDGDFEYKFDTLSFNDLHTILISNDETFL